MLFIEAGCKCMGVHYVVLFTLYIYAIIHNTKAKTCLYCVIIIMNDSGAKQLLFIYSAYSALCFFFYKVSQVKKICCSSLLSADVSSNIL